MKLASSRILIADDEPHVRELDELRPAMSRGLAIGLAIVGAGLTLWLIAAIIVMVFRDSADAHRDRKRDRKSDRREDEPMRGERSTWDRF